MADLWEILICSIPHRDEMLSELLAELDRQIGDLDDVKVVVARDNLTFSYGEKMAFLFSTACAKYISVIDDDDTVSPRYVEKIREALLQDPDYVGYVVQWQVDGKDHMPIDHSLRHGRWLTAFGMEGQDDYIIRDISEKNPIRRWMALWGHWEGGWQAEQRWSDEVRERSKEERAAGRQYLEHEIYIPQEPMYYYRYQTTAHFQAKREPLPAPLAPLPEYPWLTVHELGINVNSREGLASG